MRLLVLTAALLAACGPEPKPAPPAKTDSGSEVRILQFYAAPGIVARGEAATLCYGTENVTKVRLEPAVETLAPALSRCINVSPQTTTKYKLIAEGGAGEVREKTAEVIVSGVATPARPVGDPMRPKVVEFAARRNDVAPGTDVTFCYTLANAKDVKLFPGLAEVPNPKQGCFTVKADSTRDFTLVAVGEGNLIDRKSVTLRVK